MGKQHKDLFLNGCFGKRLELLITRLGTVAVDTREKLTDRQNEILQIVRGVMTGIQRPLFDLAHKHMADGIIQQSIFIREVRVKRGTVDLSFSGYILYRDGLKSFFSQE